jgi:DnaJ-class molecular chaperone
MLLFLPAEDLGVREDSVDKVRLVRWRSGWFRSFYLYLHLTSGGGGGSPFAGIDFGDPFDIFESFFGGGSAFRATQRQRAMPGYSASALDFMEAINGVEKEVSIEGKRRKIKIPAGVDEGQSIRFGDFILTVNIHPHEYFERDGSDIYTKVTIPFSLATLGGQIEVPTVDGDIKVRLRSGTQSGTMMRLRGKGAPSIHSRGKGDEYVKINVVVPEKLSREQKRLIEELREEGL